MWCCAAKKYQPKEEPPAATPYMEFVHIGEPHVGELELYVKNRREHVHIYTSTAEVRNKMLRNITENAQLIDQYPKGRQYLQDDEYLLILRDLLNLSNILDDMEQTGWVPYQNRTPYYNLYSKLYRMLISKAGK